jgi:ADP-dependent NAD(P)H-hydrate dehydratase
MIESLTPDVLQAMPLPSPGAHSDKNARGRILVIGSSAAVPGAALLSGVAALRAGAGKLQLAVPRSLAISIGISCPESGIIALDETEDGELSSKARQQITKSVRRADGILIGPGLMDPSVSKSILSHVLATAKGGVVVDAAALAKVISLRHAFGGHEGRIVLTPHAGEMAALLGRSKESVEANPEDVACEVAKRMRCVVALKGATTIICDAHGKRWRNENGAVGLGTSGSGDVLAGIIAGLIARGASPLVAALWSVFVHAQIGRRLSETVGPLGFLARELLPEIPNVLDELSGDRI